MTTEAIQEASSSGAASSAGPTVLLWPAALLGVFLILAGIFTTVAVSNPPLPAQGTDAAVGADTQP